LALASIGLFVAVFAALIGAGVLGSNLFAPVEWGMEWPNFADETAIVGTVLVLSVVLLLLVPLAMAAWFAPALVMLRGVGAGEALQASFLGCLRNMWPFLVYGVLLLLLIIVALVPFGLGLLVLAPVMLGSIYAGYKDIYREEP
jgi:uncharacterized membrane protein